MNNIANAIREMARGNRQAWSMVCRVDAVDREARTADCSPIDESAPLLGVNLQANQGSRHGLVVWPKVGSYVVVGFVAEGRAGVVLLADEVESVEMTIDGVTVRVDTESCCIETGAVVATIGESVVTLRCGEVKAEMDGDGIRLNGDGDGGLVRVKALESNLNQLKQYVETMKAAVSGGLNAVGVGAAASGATGASVFETAMGSAVVRYEKMENEKVKHG